MKFYEFIENEQKIEVFNERWYRHPETKKFYRNVTTILNIIDKGYNYTEWLKNVGHNAEIITDRAGTFGAKFHKLVESFLHGNEVSYYDNLELGDRAATELWERFNLWITFWKELNEKNTVKYKPENIERIVFSEEYKYAGTCDLIAMVNEEAAVFDWKTGRIVDNKSEQQQIAYMHIIGADHAFLVHIPTVKPNVKGYRVKEIDYTKEKFNLFLATKQVFDMENKDTPKVLTLPIKISKATL